MRVGCLTAVLALALFAGCSGGDDLAPQPTSPTSPPVTPAPPVAHDVARPGVPFPGRGSFVNPGGDLWVVYSRSCACADPDRLVAFYRDGGVLIATYTIAGSENTYSGQAQPYEGTLSNLLGRANPLRSHDYELGEDRGVAFERVATGTLSRGDADQVIVKFNRYIGQTPDAEATEVLDCVCAGLRIEAFGSPWQSFADAGQVSALPDEWEPVVAQMDVLETWVTG